VVGPPPDSWEVDVAATRAYPVADGIWRLRLPMPYAGIGHVNAYLLGGRVLVDCGGGGHESAYAALCAGLAEAGSAPEAITDLVVTHYHSDHMGCAARLAADTGCTVWAHPASEHFLGPHADPARYRAIREAAARQAGIAPGGLWEDFTDVREETDGIDGPVVADRVLTAGTVVPTPLGGWDVRETPGHAPSQVCLFQPERRILIAADLVGPVFAPYFDLGHTPDPVAEHLASLHVAAGLGATLALPGHGRPLEGLPELFAENLAGMEQRFAAVRAALAGGPRTVAELLGDVFPDLTDRADRVWRVVELTGYLEHLVLAGELTRTRDAAGAARYGL
jgi:glyoxylase-like metal-dependent hydrolase (beta-lactamase superfamily II)